jgi:hypothetical protein
MLPTTTPLDPLPSQMLSYKDKVKNKKKWGRACVDSLEQLGMRQFYDNLRFIENYQMVNGKFMPHHYIEEEGYTDMITQLTREFDIPSTLRHYDIIGKLINNLTEKLAEFPDVFRVEELFEEDETNEYVRTQTDLMHKSVQADINNEILGRLAAEGIDPNKQDFQSEDEAMQYQKEMQDKIQALTPPQIQKYMATTWQSQAEIWGEHQLTLDRQRYKLDSLEHKEFRDMLFTDRCFRHYYLTPDGFEQETWNPINTFFHISPDVDWTEDGDYVGRIFYLTKADVINRYGWKLDDKQLKALEDMDKDQDETLDFNGYPYKTYAPFADHKAYDIIRRGSGYDPIQNIPLLGDEALFNITGSLPYVERNGGLYRVTEVYWMSQKKYGKAVYIDQDTGQLVKDVVDENFVLPDGWKEVKGEYYDGNKINTVYWTYIDELWKGTKICFSVRDMDAIYLDLEPCDFQHRGDNNPFQAKLPVCGRIFNNRNAQSMSLVDLVKPHQVGYNMCMNQGYQIMEKEIGKFMVWDAAFFNTVKDWGGEDALQKVTLMAKELGHVIADTSPANMKGGNPGNTLPKMIDMDLTAQLMSRFKIAEMFEQRALAQLGISDQFIGQVKATETAEGIKSSISQTQLTVQKYYTDFFEYKQRCLSMNLGIAQYVQANNRDFTINYTKSDQSRVFIKMFGTDLLLKDLHVYVVNSQQLLQQMQQLKQLFLGNNTTNASPLDLAEVITANSPAAIKAKLKESYEKQQANEQQQFQQKEDEIKGNQQAAMEKENRQDGRNTENNQTKIQVAEIMAGAKGAGTTEQTPQKTESPLDYAKFNTKVGAETDRTNLQREQNEIQREKNTNDKLLKSKELDIKKEMVAAKNRESNAKVRVAKTNKNKYDRKKPQ